MTLIVILQVAGASLIVLALFHVVLWRALDWSREIDRLSPLTARVFLVHTLFIAFVLGALGALSLLEPQLLLVPSDLARLLLIAVVVFWIARLAIQPLIFDRAMRAMSLGGSWSRLLRVGATVVWVFYVAVYAAALARQFGATRTP